MKKNKKKWDYSLTKETEHNGSKIVFGLIVEKLTKNNLLFSGNLFSVRFGMSVCCADDVRDGLYDAELGVFKALGRAYKVNKNNHLTRNWNYTVQFENKFLNKPMLHGMLEKIVSDFHLNPKKYYAYG